MKVESDRKDESKMNPLGSAWLRNYNNLNESDRSDMKVDEILALFLYRLSVRTNTSYWRKAVLPFVILFRECLNEYGWSKHLSEDMELVTKQFCLESNAESAPEICNEFITVYMEMKQ